MAKIYTITCHEVYNHGASLQEYALLRFLIDLGFDAKALHYKPAYLQGAGDLYSINPRFDKPILRQLYFWMKRHEREIKRKRIAAFDAFAIQHIPTHPTLFTNNDQLKANTPEADAYICGSDQIWNSFFPNGKDLAFYLNFVPDHKLKIAYAASFAIDEIAEDVKPLVKENVPRINHVGVRETSGVRILNELGITGAQQVLDPTFLLPASHWKSQFVKEEKGDYLFIYDFDNNATIKAIALHLKEKNNWKIVTVNPNLDYADEVYYTEGPEKFLSLIYHSQQVLSNSFHALAFSLIFNKQIAVINRADKINTRMRDLLGLVGLDNYIVSSLEDFTSLAAINYEEVNSALSSHISRSKTFLIDALTSLK